jgi:hypothetical protein
VFENCIYFGFQSTFKTQFMTTVNLPKTSFVSAAAIVRTALIGAGIAYVLITLFLFVPSVHANPSWPKFWMVRPLVLVPLAGAIGGIFFCFMNILGKQNSWNMFFVNLLCIIVFIVGLWLGTVLGLDGTLWN